MSVRAFLLDIIRALENEFDVTVVVTTDKPDFLKTFGLTSRVIPFRIERSISPFRDLWALIGLFLVFKREKFDLVHSVMPKAGLLAMLAGWVARVPVRIHIFTGQVWVTKSGFSRWFLKSIDRLIAGLATKVLADSASQLDFLTKQGVVGFRKATVLANGSISGVDTSRFRPDGDRRARVRAEHLISDDEILFLYMSRLTRDKGAMVMAEAFALLCRRHDNARLLVVGPDESDIKGDMKNALASCNQKVAFVDYTTIPEDYMAAADVLCLPSFREGFGSVILLAAATGIPAIGSRIYGISDAIQENSTGLLFAPGNVGEFREAMSSLIESPVKREEMGRNAKARALREFASEVITRAQMNFYRALLTGVGSQELHQGGHGR